MAIKDRDGNVVKLRCPNPVMTTQQTWDNSKVIYHNMFFPIITVPDSRRGESMYDEECESLPVIVEEEIVTPTTSIDPPPDRNRARKINKLLEERKVEMLCLPIVIQNYNDSLYGSSYNRVQFGQKIMITGYIVTQEDLQFVFWTEKQLAEKSIVYPTKMEMKRWWRVEKITVQSGGFLISCSPSPISPDFSD